MLGLLADPVAVEVSGGDKVMACSDAARPNEVVGKRAVLHVLLQKQPPKKPKTTPQCLLEHVQPTWLGLHLQVTSGGAGLCKSLIARVVSDKAVGTLQCFK